MPSNVTIIAPSKLVEKLKQKARKLKREQGINHTDALDIVAKQANFHHWKHFIESASVTAHTEKAYLEGLILAFEISDAMDYWEKSDCDFIMDSQSLFFCEKDLRKAIPEWPEPEENNRPFKEVYPDDLAEIVQEVIDELIFYRYAGKALPATVEAALSQVQPCTDWPPGHIWLRGKYHDSGIISS